MWSQEWRRALLKYRFERYTKMPSPKRNWCPSTTPVWRHIATCTSNASSNYSAAHTWEKSVKHESSRAPPKTHKPSILSSFQGFQLCWSFQAPKKDTTPLFQKNTNKNWEAGKSIHCQIAKIMKLKDLRNVCSKKSHRLGVFFSQRMRPTLSQLEVWNPLPMVTMGCFHWLGIRKFQKYIKILHPGWPEYLKETIWCV